MMRYFLIAALLVISFQPSATAQDAGQPLPQLLLLLQKSKPDTSRVQLLLKAADQYTDWSAGASFITDSALFYASAAERLSSDLKYTDGLEKCWLMRSKILLTIRWQQLEQGKADPVVLQQAKDIHARLIRLAESRGNVQQTAALYMTLGRQFSEHAENAEHQVELFRKAATLFNKVKNREEEAIALFKLGDAYIELADLVNAEKYLQESLVIFRSTGRKDLQVLHSTLGILYTFMGDFTKGLEYGLESEKIAENLEDTSDFMGRLYNNIGITYEATKNWKKSIEYYRKALREEEKHGDISLINSIATNIAKITSLTDPKSSIAFIESIMQKYPLPTWDDANIRLNIRCMIDYNRVGDQAGAQKYCDKLMEISAKMPDSYPMQTAIFSPVIKFLVNTNQFEKAGSYLPAYRRIVEKANIPAFLKEIELRSYQVDSARGDFQSAIRHFKRYSTINDSLFNVTKAKELSELQVKYETEKKDKDLQLKEQDIELLTRQGLLQAALNDRKDRDLRLRQLDIELLQGQQELQLAAAVKKEKDLQLKDQDIKLKEQNIGLLNKENLLQQSKLKETKTSRNFMIGGAVMLVLLLALLYSRYQVKQRGSRLINAKNLALQRLVEEKEWLLKEVHHRVKNNLQTVVSLLESQSAYLQDDALLAIQDSQNRVHAMSLIHQKLYQADNVAAIDMATYLPELVNYLRDSFTIQQSIRFRLDIMPVELDVSQAVPVGLIVNEAITNSIKYAFRENTDNPVIAVTLDKAADNRVDLVISDNGAGLPAVPGTGTGGGLGLKLMKGLTDDIEGRFSIRSEEGTKITVSFIANIPLRKAGEATISNPIIQVA